MTTPVLRLSLNRTNLLARFLRKVERKSVMSVISQTLPLELLDAGDRAVVVELDGPPELVVRLEEMGIQPGACIHMIRPGSPCIIEVNHQRFSMRLEDSITVIVDVNQ